MYIYNIYQQFNIILSVSEVLELLIFWGYKGIPAFNLDSCCSTPWTQRRPKELRLLQQGYGLTKTYYIYIDNIYTSTVFIDYYDYCDCVITRKNIMEHFWIEQKQWTFRAKVKVEANSWLGQHTVALHDSNLLDLTAILKVKKSLQLCLSCLSVDESDVSDLCARMGGPFREWLRRKKMWSRQNQVAKARPGSVSTSAKSTASFISYDHLCSSLWQNKYRQILHIDFIYKTMVFVHN